MFTGFTRDANVASFFSDSSFGTIRLKFLLNDNQLNVQSRFLPKIKSKHDDINVRLAEEQFCMMKLFTTVKLT
jgi:hypothetical protein